VWRELLRGLPAGKTRLEVLGRFKAAGFTADQFEMASVGRGAATRRGARIAMADALTRVEDQLELRSGGRPSRLREALKGLRRRLEWEVFP
jgi:hypothetical protein